MGDEDDDERADREAILRRRRRFLAMALAGSTLEACASSTACLTPLDSHIRPDAVTDAGPDDAGVDAALSPDGGLPPDAAVPGVDASSFDAHFVPCLSPPLDTGGRDGGPDRG